MQAAFGSEVVRPLPIRTVPTRILFEQMILPWLDRSAVLYCPGNSIPLTWGTTRSALVVQNSNYFGDRHLSNRARVERWLCHRSIERAGAIIVISETLQHLVDAEPLRVRRGTTFLVQSGMPAPAPSAINPPFGVSEDCNFLLVLGHDYPHKRLEDIVCAWISGSGRPKLDLVIAGSVSEQRKASMTEMVYSRSTTANLRFVGVVKDEAEIAWLLSHAQCLVSASEIEAHPLTLAEAGATGCPLIISDIEAHREIAGQNATYFNVGDRVRLSQILQDPPLNRRSWKWNFTWASHAKALISILRTLAQPK